MHPPSTHISSKDAYKTHLNYIKCMQLLTEGMTIKINLKIDNKLPTAKVERFKKLSQLTWESIKGDVIACKQVPAFAQISAPWIPVKCYYYIYYLESIFLYMLNGSEVGFGLGGHGRVKSNLLGLVEKTDIELIGKRAKELGNTCNWESANKFTTTGSTINRFYYSDPQCIDSVRGKLAEYIEFAWKEKEHIEKYSTKINQEKKKNELCKIEFNLLDYFYWMRIKANYRDLDFLDFDRDITENESLNYIMNYVVTVKNYSNALFKAIEQLCKLRGMADLFTKT